MRMFKLQAIIFSLIIVFAGCSKNNDKQAMFRGNLERTGVYQTKSIKKLSALKWKFKTEDWVDSSPAISDGVVYFGS